MRRPLSRLSTVLLLGALGCSLFVDTSDLDSGCLAGTKHCSGHGCVGVNDPAYGCSLDTCLPCPNTQTRVADCAGGECVGTCLAHYGCSDCGANFLTDEDNCGGCCEGVADCQYQCGRGEFCKEGTCVVPFE